MIILCYCFTKLCGLSLRFLGNLNKKFQPHTQEEFILMKCTTGEQSSLHEHQCMFLNRILHHIVTLYILYWKNIRINFVILISTVSPSHSIQADPDLCRH